VSIAKGLVAGVVFHVLVDVIIRFVARVAHFFLVLNRIVFVVVCTCADFIALFFVAPPPSLIVLSESMFVFVLGVVVGFNVQGDIEFAENDECAIIFDRDVPIIVTFVGQK
jgi:hypothetical protein